MEEKKKNSFRNFCVVVILATFQSNCRDYAIVGYMNVDDDDDDDVSI